ncbi:MAG: DUF6282 family protein [Chloroflexota bacterium]
MTHPIPSQLARELVKEAYDMHIHSGPDVIQRIGHDIEIAEKFREVGLGGFVIKSHYSSTAGRAALAREMVSDVKVMGAICLNQAIGGMNALAVEMAAREGTKVVWFPTVDAENEPVGRQAPVPGANIPFWAHMQHQLRREGVFSEAVKVVDEEMNLLPEVTAVLRSIAKHDLILATAHLSRDEIFAVVDAALDAGVKRITITHPEFPTQNLSPVDQAALAERGAFLEHCIASIFFKKYTWETVFENIRYTGIKQVYFASDLGQPSKPPVEDGLAIAADMGLAAGFSKDEVHQMIVHNSRRLVEGKG